MLWLLMGCLGGGDQPPAAGTWLYDTQSIVFAEDTCGLQVGMVFVDAIVDQVEDSAFRYIDTNGDADSCTAASGSYDCDVRTDEVDADGATLTFATSHTGILSGETQLERTLSITGECAGDNCAELFGSVSFPCSTVVTMTAAYDGPADALDTGYED